MAHQDVVAPALTSLRSATEPALTASSSLAFASAPAPAAAAASASASGTTSSSSSARYVVEFTRGEALGGDVFAFRRLFLQLRGELEQRSLRRPLAQYIV